MYLQASRTANEPVEKPDFEDSFSLLMSGETLQQARAMMQR